MSLSSLDNLGLKKRFDTFPGAFYITNANSEVLYANIAMEEKTGYTREEMLGVSPGSLWGGGAEPIYYINMWHTLAERKSPYIGELFNIRKNGDVFQERLHIAPVFSKQNKIKYYIQFHPSLESRTRDDLTRFRKEFIHIFSRQGYYQSNIVAWLMGWMAEKDSLAREDSFLAKRIITEYSNITEIFLQECVGQKQLRVDDSQEVKLFSRVGSINKKFPVFYRLYKEKILKYFIYRLNGNSVVAEDLMQETFQRAFSYISSYRPTNNASYLTYLYRIAHNLLVNFYRKKKSVSYNEFPDYLSVFTPDYETDLLKNVLWNHVDFLSKIEQQVMIMKYKHQLSVREIAVALGKTENAIKLHLSRARKKLKVFWADKQ